MEAKKQGTSLRLLLEASPGAVLARSVLVRGQKNFGAEGEGENPFSSMWGEADLGSLLRIKGGAKMKRGNPSEERKTDSTECLKER